LKKGIKDGATDEENYASLDELDKAREEIIIACNISGLFKTHEDFDHVATASLDRLYEWVEKGMRMDERFLPK
jgi:hypothetical protein